MGMVEVLVASAVMGVVLVSIIAVYNSMANLSLKNTDAVQANFSLEEGAEIVRVLRDTSWSNISSLTNGTTYRFLWNTSTWVATTSVFMIDQFDRTVVFSAVNRDSNFNIVQSGGTLDTGTRKATISVAYQRDGATTTKSLEMYIFNTFNN